MDFVGVERSAHHVTYADRHRGGRYGNAESSGKKFDHVKYRGQLDESRPGNTIPVSGSDLREALDAVLEGKKVIFDQKPSIGCNIKWHPGNEPFWFG